MELKVRNVNQAFSRVFRHLNALDLKPEETRNGPAIVFPGIVTTVYLRPNERVLFHVGRDANPIFHLVESIWMLAGRKDVEFLVQFNKRMGTFSDDGVQFNAAYGHRWRRHFGYDQLLAIIQTLRTYPKTRQAVMQIWDPEDLTKATLDKACNTQVVFDTRGDKLNMTVFNRSNDIWWGAYGANAVHFSFMQEFVACSVGLPIGEYRQVSNNFHLYLELYDAAKYVLNPPDESHDLYSSGLVKPYPLMGNMMCFSFLEDCENFCVDPFREWRYNSPFFHEVARPVALVARARKLKISDGRDVASKLIKAEDWSRAVLDWIDRREEKKRLKDKNACLTPQTYV